MIRPLVHREIRDAVHRYWFVVNAAVFASAGLLLMLFGQSDAMVLGYRGFARSMAGLMHLALVFVPLMAIIPAVVAISGERETGTLDYILAQPVTASQVFASKWLGVTVAVLVSVLIGLGITGVVALLRGVPGMLIFGLMVLTLLLAAAFVSIGLLVSSFTASRTRATSIGLTVWLILLGLGTLGIMSSFVQWGLQPLLLQAWAVVNPIEAYRLAGVTILDPGATSLGAVGQALIGRFGQTGVVALAATSMISWCVGGLALGKKLFSARAS